MKLHSFHGLYKSLITQTLPLNTKGSKNYSAFKTPLVLIEIRLISGSIKKQNIEYIFCYQYSQN